MTTTENLKIIIRLITTIKWIMSFNDNMNHKQLPVSMFQQICAGKTKKTAYIITIWFNWKSDSWKQPGGFMPSDCCWQGMETRNTQHSHTQTKPVAAATAVFGNASPSHNRSVTSSWRTHTHPSLSNCFLTYNHNHISWALNHPTHTPAD